MLEKLQRLGDEMTYSLGDYKGQMRNGQRHGKGELLYKEQDYYFPTQYDGDWQDDRIEGQGVMYYNDNSMYSGYWKNGVRQGEGALLFFNDGAEIIGKDGKIKYENSYEYYSGCWNQDQRAGQGLMTFKNTNQYEGEWKSNKFSKGTYTNYMENWTFTGTFNNEYPIAGTLTYSDKEKTEQIISQNWKQVSIHEQRPVAVDAKSTQIEKTPIPKKTMSEYFKKIYEKAAEIIDDYEEWCEDMAEEKPSFPRFRKKWT